MHCTTLAPPYVNICTCLKLHHGTEQHICRDTLTSAHTHLQLMDLNLYFPFLGKWELPKLLPVHSAWTSLWTCLLTTHHSPLQRCSTWPPWEELKVHTDWISCIIYHLSRMILRFIMHVLVFGSFYVHLVFPKSDSHDKCSPAFPILFVALTLLWYTNHRN